MSLSVRLFKRFPGFTLDVEWHVDNEFVILFGYSGSGKSTTLELIAGLKRPDKGFVRLNGEVLYDSERGICLPPQKRHIGYMFQDSTLFPHMKVWKNIAFGGKHLDKAKREEKVMEMIEIFHLKGLEDKFPSEISGGQKRRVALAMVLMREPKALLLDEPLSALDSPIKMEVMDLLGEVKRRFSIPIVLVTHDIFEAVSLADKMVIYIDGKVAQIGTPYEIMDNPLTPEVERLFSTRELLSKIPL